VQLTLLGTGTSQGVPIIGCQCPVCNSTDSRDNRLRTAALFHNDNTNIAIDCGPDFRQQMLRQDVKTLDAILITHTHNDHVIGLDDVRPFNFSMNRSIPVYGLEEHLEEIRLRFNYFFKSDPYPGAPRLNLHPIKPYVPLEIEGIEVLPLLLKHGALDVLGFRIGSKAYLTDTNYIPKRTIAALQDLEVLILDALHHKKHHSHFNLNESIEVAQRIDAERTFLIHISHKMGLHSTTDDVCPPNIHLGYDGLTLN